VVAEHQAKLPRLFKRYQIQPVWRADRPARGRFREFFQCDVDALGSTSPVVEAELCAAVADAMGELGFGDFVIRFNHRELLTALLSAAGIDSSRSTSSTRSVPMASQLNCRRGESLKKPGRSCCHSWTPRTCPATCQHSLIA
jgi:histidyl-tRNA synthetase